MNSNLNEVRPEEGTLKATTQTAIEAKESKDPRADKPRKVISWLKSCNSEKTLETLKTHSEDELNEVLKICNIIKAIANDALDDVAEKELEKAREQREKDEANLAKSKEREAMLEARVEAKRRPAEQQ